MSFRLWSARAPEEPPSERGPVDNKVGKKQPPVEGDALGQACPPRRTDSRCGQGRLTQAFADQGSPGRLESKRGCDLTAVGLMAGGEAGPQGEAVATMDQGTAAGT